MNIRLEMVSGEEWRFLEGGGHFGRFLPTPLPLPPPPSFHARSLRVMMEVERIRSSASPPSSGRGENI